MPSNLWRFHLIERDGEFLLATAPIASPASLVENLTLCRPVKFDSC